MPTDSDLIPELAAWNEGQGISAVDWLFHVGRFDLMLAFTSLLWPALVEVDGRVFVSSSYSAHRHQQMLSQGTSPEKAQIFMNALVLSDMFENANESPSDELLRELAKRLQAQWTAKARSEFPARGLAVLIDDSLDDDGGGELLITLVDRET